MTRTFIVSEAEVGIYQIYHMVGNPECESGWCGGSYPRLCECGGLLHADWYYGTGNGEGFIEVACDSCDVNFIEEAQ